MGRFFCVTAPAGRENVEGTEEQPVGTISNRANKSTN